MFELTAVALSYDILPALKEHGMPSGFTDQAAYEELVSRLEDAPTFQDRVRLSDELVAMQNGEVEGSSEQERSLAAKMSLLMGMSVTAYFSKLNRLDMPEVE